MKTLIFENEEQSRNPDPENVICVMASLLTFAEPYGAEFYQTQWRLGVHRNVKGGKRFQRFYQSHLFGCNFRVFVFPKENCLLVNRFNLLQMNSHYPD
jgi:hypothetical protein